MKKFLSSLLALTMILSLVIVPANAATSVGATGSFTISGPTTASEGDTVSFSITNPKITYNGTDYAATVSNYQWTGLGDSVTANTETYSGTVGNQNLSINCTVTLNATVGSGESATQVTVENSTLTTAKSVTVTTKQAAFETAVKQATVTYKGRTYSFNNSTSVTIDKFSADSETLSAEDLRLNVTGYNSAVITENGYNSAVITENGYNWAVKSSSAADALSVSVTVNYTPVTGQTLSISGTGVTASGDNYAATVYSGQSLKLTASYARTGSKSVGYAWSSTPAGATLNNTDSQTSTFIAPDVNANTIYTVTCIAKEGSSESIRKTVTITVKPDPYSPSRNGEDATKTIATNNSASCTIAAPVLKSTNDTVYYQSSNTANFDITRLQRTPTAALL